MPAPVSPAVSGTPGCNLRRLGERVKLHLSKGYWRRETVPFDQPVGVVSLLEFQQRLSEFFDGFEGPDPEQVFFECANKPLGAAVSFRSAHEGGRTLDTGGKRSPSGSDRTCIASRGHQRPRSTYDPVGGPNFAKLISAMSFGGIIFIYGLFSPGVTALPVLDMIAKIITVEGRWCTQLNAYT
jgi:hypothetical protein